MIIMSQITRWKPLNTRAIINNLKKIFETKDIGLLTKPTYNFLYLTSGFIAHYDKHGFQCHYRNVDDLIRDLKSSNDIERPQYYLSSFFQNDDHSKYY